MMEQYLLKMSGPSSGALVHEPKETRVQKILDDPDNCLVIVRGYLPAGARKGDRFDVDISLPHGSKSTSLVGGQLQLCDLRIYQAASALSPRFEGSQTMLPSHVFGYAKGPLVVGFGNNTDANELKRGKVWQGGVSRVNRPFSLFMRTDDKSVRVANAVAERINFMFQDDARARSLHHDFTDAESRILNLGNVANQLNQRYETTGINQTEMAKAAGKEAINVRVPYAYRFNHERFLEVSRMTPLRDNDQNLPRYRQRLQKMLLDPRDALQAALRLEALGNESKQALKDGLDSKHPFVRFASAEALAYLGSTLGVDALTELPQQHGIFARPATIALASLGEEICRDKLAFLMAHEDRSLRCAACNALVLLDETDPRLGGEFLRDTFWLYRAPHAPNPMVYFSTSKRPQVVLFGRNLVLAPGTSMMVGKDFTVKHYDNDGKFYVKRITTRGEAKRVCSNRLDELLMALADLGASYPDIVEFLRQADRYQHASYPIVNWQVPDASLAAINDAGRQMK
jgi:hypothetical protein